MMVRFMNAGGNHAWIDAEAVEALDSVWSDGTVDGGKSDKAKLLTRVHLRSGASVDLDASIEHVAEKLNGATAK